MLLTLRGYWMIRREFRNTLVDFTVNIVIVMAANSPMIQVSTSYINTSAANRSSFRTNSWIDFSFSSYLYSGFSCFLMTH